MDAITDMLRQLLAGTLLMPKLRRASAPRRWAVMWGTKRIVCLTYSGSMVAT